MDITTDFQIFEAESLAPLDTRGVWSGLLQQQRSLVPWMLYDSEGSRLFEYITTLPECYPTRTERDILASYAEAIITATDHSRPLRVLDLGAGTATKTGILPERQHRLPVAGCAATADGGELRSRCTSVRASATSPPEARTILRNLRSELRAGDALLLGTDMVKDKATLVRAYNDKAGVTAAFNLNVLHRLNRELGANFDIDCFRHRARWNRVKSRIEMHLESTRDQCVNIAAAQLSVEFAAFETIHTESSYKFTQKSLAALLDDAGFRIEQTWTDPRQWYGAYARGPSVITVH